MFIGMFTYAQKLEGVGKFIIGETTSDIIKNIEKETGVQHILISKIDLYDDLYEKEYNDIKIYEILIDTTFSCKNSKVFYISEYTISNIKYRNVFLVFNDNLLVEFRCDKSTEIDVLFARKYGRPYIYQKDLTNQESSTLKYDEHIKRFIWKYLNINAISFEKIQVFEGVQRVAVSIFIIYDRNHKYVINDCDIFIGNLENIKIEDI